jgi:hypothetical protein
MPADRSTQLARLVERLGTDLSVPDARERRIGRARRVQDAWLRDLGGLRTTDAAAESETSPDRDR